MKLYEGMVVFPEPLKEEALDEAVGRFKAEVEKLGGAVESVTRLGKRSFARPLRKQRAGHYAVIAFRLDGGQVQPLRARLRLMPEVFRAQITRAATPPPADASGAEKEEKTDDVA